MKILAVDTATAWQSVALLDDQTVLALQEQDAPASHTRLLLPAIRRLFAHTGLSLTRLDGLAVSIGPGSFTGLRVGLATLLGFRTISGLPLAVVPTLEGMAWNFRGADVPLCPIVNSRRGEVYWAIFRWRNDRLERLVAERTGTAVQLAASLSERTMLYGEGSTLEGEAIRTACPDKIRVLIETPNRNVTPSAVSVGLAGIDKLRRGERAGLGISPLYVQRPEAEVKYDESGGLSPLARRRAKLARKLAPR
ncbi:MAG TPA: tRNA (adenosine(37)-N6)-threonylcarbamoyltransferase complex dimerization subunit type 1 TsaB [Nitrospira sp.]|nr:tRNA (adenosine(37)-N6)-threonylcarbamoyltransferase complex dimerization subunit type 1 TsaB [Nitrospira sp.]